MMVGLNTEYFTDSAPPLELADSKPSYVICKQRSGTYKKSYERCR